MQFSFQLQVAAKAQLLSRPVPEVFDDPIPLRLIDTSRDGPPAPPMQNGDLEPLLPGTESSNPQRIPLRNEGSPVGNPPNSAEDSAILYDPESVTSSGFSIFGSGNINWNVMENAYSSFPPQFVSDYTQQGLSDSADGTVTPAAEYSALGDRNDGEGADSEHYTKWGESAIPSTTSVEGNKPALSRKESDAAENVDPYLSHQAVSGANVLQQNKVSDSLDYPDSVDDECNPDLHTDSQFPVVNIPDLIAGIPTTEPYVELSSLDDSNQPSRLSDGQPSLSINEGGISSTQIDPYVTQDSSEINPYVTQDSQTAGVENLSNPHSVSSFTANMENHSNLPLPSSDGQQSGYVPWSEPPQRTGYLPNKSETEPGNQQNGSGNVPTSPNKEQNGYVANGANSTRNEQAQIPSGYIAHNAIP